MATSRINFRLLAGEAKRRNKQLAIVAGDPSVQSVVRSAGLPVFATVGEYEKAEAARVSRGSGLATAGSAAAALDELALTVRPQAPAGRTAVKAASPGGSLLDRRFGPARVPLSVIVGLVAVVVLVVGLGAFFFYPSATVALTLREEPVGPLSLNVTIDPNVSAPNDQAATVPGAEKGFPVTISGTFNATGQNVVDTQASGTVTFTSTNTVFAVPVLAGTQLSTASGIAFVTTKTVSVPTADFASHTPGTANAPVQAVPAGTSGNVAAGKIVKLPSDLVAAKLTVTNAAATTGGTHTVTPMIVQADIDKAESNLMAQVNASFQAALKAPDAAPSGSTLFSVSARLGVTMFDPDPQGLLNQQLASFQLDASATGTAVVADLASVRKLAEGRVKSAVKGGYSLVDGSISTDLGAATTQAGAVVVPVTAQGRQTRIVDVGRVRAAVQGMSVEEARTYLGQYGHVDISVSPGWASTMPSFDFRIDVQLVEASPQPTAGTSQSGSPSPSPGATPAPSSSGGSPSSSPRPGGTSSPSAS